MGVDVSGWHDFYIMAGGAAASLTGLVVVALSLHAKAIMSHPLYRDRAFAAIVALMTQVFLAAAVLVPTQSSLALGLEVGVVGVFWLARSVWRFPASVATQRDCGAGRTSTAGRHPIGCSSGPSGSCGSSRSSRAR